MKLNPTIESAPVKLIGIQAKPEKKIRQIA
jgi:hypothetical protein